MHTINKDIKNLKYVKSIKKYKKLTQIHLNYKFKKITFKNFQIHGLSDCLAKGVRILDGMKCSPLLASRPGFNLLYSYGKWCIFERFSHVKGRRFENRKARQKKIKIQRKQET